MDFSLFHISACIKGCAFDTGRWCQKLFFIGRERKALRSRSWSGIMLLNPIAGFFAWAVHRKKIHKKPQVLNFIKIQWYFGTNKYLQKA